MADPIKLKLAAVKAAGLRAYERKGLSAQGPTPACMYRDNSGLPCVIGAAITDDEIANAKLYGPLSLLRAEKKVWTDRPDEMEALQKAHDDWVRGLKGMSGCDPAEAEARLLKLLRAA